MNDEIPFTQWPQFLQRLGKIFSEINAHLTFLLSHSRSTIPSFDHFRKLNPSVTQYDLAIIKYFLPKSDVFYEYVDKEQLFSPGGIFYTEEKGYHMNKPDTMDAVYESLSKDQLPDQVLIFTFEDMKIDNIAAFANNTRRNIRRQNTETNDFFNHTDLTTQKLSHSQLLPIIRTRSEKFNLGVTTFIRDNDGLNVDELFLMDKLEQLAQDFIPKRMELLDPVSQINKRRKIVPDRDTFLTSEDMVKVLKKSKIYQDQIIFQDTFTQAKEAQFKPLDLDFFNIHPALVYAIKSYKGIDIEHQLYSHQTDALEALLDDSVNHVITSTPTSSGKSMIYQIPILNDILWDMENDDGRTKTRQSTAIFVFPTKALAQDQKKHLDDLINHLPEVKYRIIVDTYDGDTEGKAKAGIRHTADIIFTNPDTIHASILPNHDGLNYAHGNNGWDKFLGGLKYVVMDEIHVYKGSFGVNVGYVMARLQRVLATMDHQPLRFISSSATVLNPIDHFRIVCAIPSQESVVHVSNDGSASCDKQLLIWQPPPLMNKRGEVLSTHTEFSNTTNNPNFIPRVNVVYESARLLLSLLSGSPHLKLIAFCPIRKVTETLMKEVRTLLGQSNFSNCGIDERDIMVYRGGYSKQDRRDIENKMFTGELRALIATNALELGVDLSYLDVVITCSFPISKMNMHQQFGRAGRGSKAKGSLAIFVPGGVPVDQYYVEHPQEILDKTSYEDLCVKGLIDSDMHRLIMENHLQCAAFELPLTLEDSKWFCHGSKDPKKIQFFEETCKKKLNTDKLGRYRTDPSFLPWPPEKVAIRAIETPGYAVVDITNGRDIVIEEVEESRTSFTLYEGGIFLHQGLPYLVKEFNTEKKFAKVVRVTVDWTTQQRDFTDVDPYEIEYVRCLSGNEDQSDIPAYFGKILTTIIVFGFFKVNKKGEILEAVEVKNPPVKYKSKGFWLDIPRKALDAIETKNLSKAGGIHAAQHLIMNILPIFIGGNVETDPNTRFTGGQSELITDCKAPEKEFAQRQTSRVRPGRLIFHDAKGGSQGSGVSAKTFEHVDEILVCAYDRIRHCDCEWGCIQCVTPNFCKEGGLVMSKPAAYIILGYLVGRNLEELMEEVVDGPEPNLPDIKVDTIEPATTVVKMSPDIEIVEVKRAEPLKPIKKET
ncbi:ATP-dependent helicase Hrq1p [[Candida] jaroonii]|uniref:ATP-dependent helicase Hrq1p n=1 Tax=[Candida] jaroonii TaxID=467808 RepID=A0ACA9Y6E8_9ASCO|nr:ATP-dependent helicase Hrq1p [[Candida] jaroonii]